MRLNIHGVAFTILLGALTALPPLAIDMGLPALEGIKHSLNTGDRGAGLTLSVFLAGFSLAQLALGPLSDRIGRRPVLLAGLALFAAGGLGCAATGSITALILWRLAQGSGAAAGTVMALAMVRDLFEGAEARQKLSFIATVTPLAPMIAPTLGGLMLLATGWRGIYTLLAAAGSLLTLLVATGTQETHRPSGIRPGLLAAYASVLRHRQAGGLAVANALLFGMLFAWVSASPLVLMGRAGVSAPVFGVLFACTSGGLLVGAWINGRLAARQVPARLPLLAGLAGAAAASIVVLLLSLTPLSPLALVPVVVVAMVFRGLAGPNLTHGVLEPLPAIAGVVSAVLGATQMAAGSAISALVAALLPRFGPAAVGGAMAICAVAALLMGILATRRYPA